MALVKPNPLGYTAQEWKDLEGMGIRLHDANGKVISDSAIQLQLNASTLQIGKELGIKFYQKEQKPNGLRFKVPEEGEVAGTDYDHAIDALDYFNNSFTGEKYLWTRLPWGPVDKINSWKLGFPNTLKNSFSIPTELVAIKRHPKVVQVVPVPVSGISPALPFVSGHFFAFGTIPGGQFFDYQGGMSDEEVQCDYPIILRFIGAHAGMYLLNVAQNLTDPGISSRSVSADGISQSKSFTQSAVYGLYSATIDRWEKMLKDEYRQFKRNYMGVINSVVA